jgi:pimeloyl-ACP methyl ester carboxylesterase
LKLRDDFFHNHPLRETRKPSWYAASKLDQTINPDLERFLAKRMNATTVELEAGHLSLVSHPKEIADLILAAAGRQK